MQIPDAIDIIGIAVESNITVPAKIKTRIFDYKCWFDVIIIG